MGVEWCAGANRVDTTRLAERSALPIKDTPANPVELLSLDALGSVTTVGGIETSPADQEGGRATHACFDRQLFQQTSLGCVKPHGAT